MYNLDRCSVEEQRILSTVRLWSVSVLLFGALSSVLSLLVLSMPGSPCVTPGVWMLIVGPAWVWFLCRS